MFENTNSYFKTVWLLLIKHLLRSFAKMVPSLERWIEIKVVNLFCVNFFFLISSLWWSVLVFPQCREQDFKCNVRGVYGNDASMRQITEAVDIRRERAGINNKMEWGHARMPRIIMEWKKKTSLIFKNKCIQLNVYGFN